MAAFAIRSRWPSHLKAKVIGTVSSTTYVDNTLRRDAILHWIDGGVYNLMERNTPASFAPEGSHGPLIYRGHSAPAGIMRYRGSQFRPGLYRHFFCSRNFNTHRLYRLMVDRVGATFSAAHEVFSSSDTDTHFTDVMEDADGSLLVVDTGDGFSTVPTSQSQSRPIKAQFTAFEKRTSPWSTTRAVPNYLGTQRRTKSCSSVYDDPRFCRRGSGDCELAKRGSAAVSAIEHDLRWQHRRSRLQSVFAAQQIRVRWRHGGRSSLGEFGSRPIHDDKTRVVKTLEQLFVRRCVPR